MKRLMTFLFSVALFLSPLLHAHQPLQDRTGSFTPAMDVPSGKIQMNVVKGVSGTFLEIVSQYASIEMVTIHNAAGELTFEQNVFSHSLQIDLGTTGSYVVRVDIENGKTIQKKIKVI